MGLDGSLVKFLCCAKMLGADFSSVAMIGRQALYPDVGTLSRVFMTLGVDHSAELFLERAQYAEEFFSLLGTREIHSVDLSPYEGASILHDMNRPIPSELRERFTLVHDGGSLEHVFNIPQALRTAWRW
jgi:hypothetical protein